MQFSAAIVRMTAFSVICVTMQDLSCVMLQGEICFGSDGDLGSARRLLAASLEVEWQISAPKDEVDNVRVNIAGFLGGVLAPTMQQDGYQVCALLQCADNCALKTVSHSSCPKLVQRQKVVPHRL